MTLQEVIEAIDQLSVEDLRRVKQEVLTRENLLNRQKPRTLKEWEALTNAFLNEFWADTDEVEKQATLAAMREKNIPASNDD